MSTEESATATEDIPTSSEDKDTLELEPLISVLSGAQKDMLILRAIQRDRSLVDTLIEFALDPLTHERALMRASELEPSAIASSVRSYALAGSRLNAIMLLRATTERVLAALTELDETIRDVGLQKFLEEEAKPELEVGDMRGTESGVLHLGLLNRSCRKISCTAFQGGPPKKRPCHVSARVHVSGRRSRRILLWALSERSGLNSSKLSSRRLRVLPRWRSC